jgi:phosphatidylinositol alpha-1,6-mannosyltransferase
MKKILFITNDFGPRAGGIETFIIGLIERLPKNSVAVYTSRQEGSSAYDRKWLEDFGVTVIRDKRKILLPTPRVARIISRIAREIEPTVACFGAATPLGLLAPTLRRSGVRRIVSLTHGHEVWWSKVFPFNLIMKRIGNKVDALSYLGEFTRAAISKSVGEKAKAAMIKIAPGIDTYHFAPSTRSLDLRRELGLIDKKVIVCVGRLVHRKGQDRLIEALPEIALRVPSVHLLLVGEGPHRKFLERIAAKHGVADRVTFIGRVKYDELPFYFGVGDVFAMPSRSRFFGLEVEGLGIVYLEASSCGLPVLAGSSGGAPDAVLVGETGIVVDGQNIQEVADGVSRLLLDSTTARSMGIAGRRWVVERWSWDLWSSAFKDFIDF